MKVVALGPLIFEFLDLGLMVSPVRVHPGLYRHRVRKKIKRSCLGSINITILCFGVNPYRVLNQTLIIAVYAAGLSFQPRPASGPCPHLEQALTRSTPPWTKKQLRKHSNGYTCIIINMTLTAWQWECPAGTASAGTV